VLLVTGFWFWGSFPRLVRTGIKVDPEGLSCVLSRLTLALPMPEYFPLGLFGRWAAQSAPTPRTSRILATHLVRIGSKVKPVGSHHAHYLALLPRYG
jgi:hypothetical protein